MSALQRAMLSSLHSFFGNKKKRRLFYLAVLCVFTFGSFLLSGLARRTFIFHSSIDGSTIIEDRMLRQSKDKETDIRRYVDEVLLGPATPDSAPLFPRETRLHSFMYRDGIVYVDLTEPAAIPLGETGDVFPSLLTLNMGIRRNFSQVKDVRLFIGGNEVFFNEFQGIFANSADNRRIAP